jgi:hypothetical protein
MKTPISALTAVALLALGAGSAGAQRAVHDPDSAASVAGVIEMWQQRILAENLPVADAKNWALRNLAKFSRLTPERAALAQRAATLGELDALLVSAPIADGTSLELLLASKPGNISMVAAKTSPAASPTSYADLSFTALTPCRILDSRTVYGGTGPWAANSTNTIKIGPYPAAGGGYATGAGAQGGSATGCALDTLAGSGEIAAIMTAVSTVSQTGAGYLTFFSYGTANPAPYGVSQWFQPGYVQTSFVVMPTDLAGSVATQGFAGNNGAEVIIDIVGYFAKIKSDLWAVVDATGTLARGYRTTSSAKISLGGYEVIFKQDVTGCVYNVSLGNIGSIGTVPNGQIAVASRTTDVKGVWVNTFDSTGALADFPFHLRVKC